MTMKKLAPALAVVAVLSIGMASADGAWPALDAKSFDPEAPAKTTDPLSMDAKVPDAKASDPKPTTSTANDAASDERHVGVCDAYGEGYTYSPGTDTCIKVGGYVKFGIGSRGGSSDR